MIRKFNISRGHGNAFLPVTVKPRETESLPHMSTILSSAAGLPATHDQILTKLTELYRDLFNHNGYGTLRVEMRFLKKGQKEIFLICGKEYRFIVDYPGEAGEPHESGGKRG